MHGRTRMVLVFLALLLLPTFALAEFMPDGAKAIWPDYRTPLTGVTVFFDEATVIWVDLPETFLQNRTEVELVWTIMSRVYDASDNRHRPTFKSCKPRLRVGRGRASGLYEPEMDFNAGLATLHTNVQTRHLKPGKNKIKVMCHRSVMCLGGRCQFVITEMYFAEAVMEAPETEKAPAAGEDPQKQAEKLVLAQQWDKRCFEEFYLAELRARVARELSPAYQADANRILEAKNWDVLHQSIPKLLVKHVNLESIRTLAASKCGKLTFADPKAEGFADFLSAVSAMMDYEINMLKEELKKEPPKK